MGLTFHRVLIQSKGPSSLLKLKSAVPKAAKALGYQVCTEGHGITRMAAFDREMQMLTRITNKLYI